LLEAAHTKIVDSVKQAEHLRLMRNLRCGRIVQEDSRKFLELQAADIAAGVAATLYEQHPDNRREGAAAIRRCFSRVMLNSEWL
jgi:hypothetical protein